MHSRILPVRRRPPPAGRRFLRSCILAGVLLSPPAAALDLQKVIECSTPSPNIYCIFGEPVVSPDGYCVAFTNATTYPPWYEWWPGIALASLDGGACTPTQTVASSGNWHRAPAWSPDGSTLAFVSEGSDPESAGIWRVAVGDVGEPPASLTRVVAAHGVHDPAWSLDGASIAYAAFEGVFVVPGTGGTPSLMIPGGRTPSWGPAGEIVFERGGDLWIRGSDGIERHLTSTADFETEPAWAPSGTWIAYVAYQGGNWDLWVIAASGGTPVRVTSSPESEGHPSWSARGDRLVYAATITDHDSIWLATNLPDWTIGVEERSWTRLKELYR